MVQVFHNPKTTFFKTNPLVDVVCIDEKDKVAEVNTDDLEEAFKLTNSIDTAWYSTDNADVKVIKPSRSTSVGDFLVKNNEWYSVEPCGFTKVQR